MKATQLGHIPDEAWTSLKLGYGVQFLTFGGSDVKVTEALRVSLGKAIDEIVQSTDIVRTTLSQSGDEDLDKLLLSLLPSPVIVDSTQVGLVTFYSEITKRTAGQYRNAQGISTYKIALATYNEMTSGGVR